MRLRIYWNIGIRLFCDPTLGDNILGRLHKIYIVGYKGTHHLSSVFDWWSYLFTKVGVLDHGPQNITWLTGFWPLPGLWPIWTPKFVKLAPECRRLTRVSCLRTLRRLDCWCYCPPALPGGPLAEQLLLPLWRSFEVCLTPRAAVYFLDNKLAIKESGLLARS